MWMLSTAHKRKGHGAWVSGYPLKLKWNPLKMDYNVQYLQLVKKTIIIEILYHTVGENWLTTFKNTNSLLTNTKPHHPCFPNLFWDETGFRVTIDSRPTKHYVTTCIQVYNTLKLTCVLKKFYSPSQHQVIFLRLFNVGEGVGLYSGRLTRGWTCILLTQTGGSCQSSKLMRTSQFTPHATFPPNFFGQRWWYRLQAFKTSSNHNYRPTAQI